MSDRPANLDFDEQVARIRHFQVMSDRNAEAIRKLTAEAHKLEAERAKLNRDRTLSPWIVAFGGVGGIVTIVALILRAFNIIKS